MRLSMRLKSPTSDWLRAQEETKKAKISWLSSANHKAGGLGLIFGLLTISQSEAVMFWRWVMIWPKIRLSMRPYMRLRSWQFLVNLRYSSHLTSTPTSYPHLKLRHLITPASKPCRVTWPLPAFSTNLSLPLLPTPSLLPTPHFHAPAS